MKDGNRHSNDCIILCESSEVLGIIYKGLGVGMGIFKSKVLLAMALVISLVGGPQTGTAQEVSGSPKAAEIFTMEIGDVKNVHRSGNLIFSGQFSPDDLQSMKSLGIQRVITLRNEGEADFDEPEAVTDADLEFHRVPFASEEALTDEVFNEVRDLLRDDTQKTLLHCGSANRVGGVWLTYRVLDQGVDVATAVAEAKKIGLRTPYIERKALDYIARQEEAQSSKPAKPKGNADVTFVEATKTGDSTWTFEVTVKHPDVGWRDFADGWDVVLPGGKAVLLQPKDRFTRVLAHPHVDEQPFTRTQEKILIPAKTKYVTVRAHDLVDGYGGKEVKVNLEEAEGTGFKVVR